MDWRAIEKATTDLETVLDKQELGTLNDVKAKLYIKSGVAPKFFKPRSVSHALKAGIEKELERLEEMGVMEKVRYSEWAAPIVTVVKVGDKSSILICGDYKITISSALEVIQRPLPNPEELFVTLSGGETLAKLDSSHTRRQLSSSYGFLFYRTETVRIVVSLIALL